MTPKSSIRKKVKKSRNRHIPKHVDIKVQKQHFFECAWCGLHLTDKHHIVQFSDGGEHSVDNLILLCPVCHRKVHKSEIPTADLVKRKSTHLKADRISGGFKTTMETLKIKVGGGFFIETPIILDYKGDQIISLQKTDDSILLNLRFYSIRGDLILWMSENYFWTLSKNKINSSLDFLEIKQDEGDFFFKAEKENDYLKVTGKTYLNGNLIEFDEDKTSFGNTILKGITSVRCQYALKIG